MAVQPLYSKLQNKMTYEIIEVSHNKYFIFLVEKSILVLYVAQKYKRFRGQFIQEYIINTCLPELLEKGKKS